MTAPPAVDEPNGNTIDREARLITAEHSGRRVTPDRARRPITIIADKYNGKKLNSPNDAVVAAMARSGSAIRPYGIAVL